ncbi:MAG: hypothetical protein J5I91_00215 [Bacteroidetes bacterium]|nr:hypothetical protein [Bacteroidota bacterium]
MRYFKILFILPLILLSCSGNKKNTVERADFFSLSNFFDKETKRLSNQKISLVRVVRIDDNVSQSTDTAPDWNNEFYLLKNCDINKPQLKYDYKVDSVIKGEDRHYFYDNISGTQRVRNIHVFWSGDSVPELIEITIKEKNYLKDEEFIYSYQPDKAIGIMGTRKTLFSPPKEFDILNEIKRR